MSYNKTVNDFQSRMPRWISCSMDWSILVFTSSKVINCILFYGWKTKMFIIFYSKRNAIMPSKTKGNTHTHGAFCAATYM